MSRTCCGSAKRQIFPPARSRSGVSQWDARLWQSSRRAIEHPPRLLPPIILGTMIRLLAGDRVGNKEYGSFYPFSIVSQEGGSLNRILIFGLPRSRRAV